jgi:pimeloyl-ACP methyl ester carboxylesterase
VPVELAVTEGGSGPPLVLLHAFPLAGAMWEQQRALLAGGCRVVAPDQRGFGGSPLGDDEPSLDRCADDVAALLDRLSLDRVVLGGSSMGGYVAMALLRRHPERVRALVLAGTKATADPPEAADGRRAMADRLEVEGSGVLVEAVLPALLGPTTREQRPEVAARLREQVAAAPPAAAAWAQRAMAARPDSLPTLAAADVPALVVVGEEDALAPVEQARTMAEALPRGELVVIRGAGHLPPLETPQPFADAVAGLLRRL